MSNKYRRLFGGQHTAIKILVRQITPPRFNLVPGITYSHFTLATTQNEGSQS
jgi:hypothetical protein